MGIAIRKFYYKAGSNEAAVVTEIQTALAAAGWVSTVSDGETLYRSALPDPNGNYAYVWLTANDGSSRIGMYIGGTTGSDTNGLANGPTQPFGKSANNTSGYHTVWASERWFCVYPNHYDARTRLFLGGGLYFPVTVFGGGDTNLFAFSNQNFNSATTKQETLFATLGANAPMVGTLFNDWYTLRLNYHASHVQGSGFEVGEYGGMGPSGVPFAGVSLMKDTSPIGGRVGFLYDAYSPTVDPSRHPGCVADSLSFEFNGWKYYAPQADSDSMGTYGFFGEVNGGRLYLRMEAVT